MNLWISDLSKWSLTQSSSIKGRTCFLQTFSLVSWVKDSWGLTLALKTEAKKAFSFSASPVTRVIPAPFSSRPTFSPAFLLLLMDLKKPFFLSLTSFARYYSRKALTRRNSAYFDNVPIFIPSSLSLLLPPLYLLLVFEFYVGWIPFFCYCLLPNISFKFVTAPYRV